MNYTKIKTFDDACNALQLDAMKALPDVSMMPEKHQKSITAYCKLIIIAEALNEGWQPNYSDTNEYKYYPYFWVKADADNPAGVGFEDSVYDYWCTGTDVGSRLCFKSSDLSEYAAATFEDLYKEYLLLN